MFFGKFDSSVDVHFRCFICESEFEFELETFLTSIHFKLFSIFHTYTLRTYTWTNVSEFSWTNCVKSDYSPDSRFDTKKRRWLPIVNGTMSFDANCVAVHFYSDYYLKSWLSIFSPFAMQESHLHFTSLVVTQQHSANLIDFDINCFNTLYKSQIRSSCRCVFEKMPNVGHPTGNVHSYV